MKISVAGAGAGKTTMMAELITKYEIPAGKIVFCIAFTHAAVRVIETKVKSLLGFIPDNIKISTIHSFLYQELIVPYYFFLYEKHFEKLSAVKLPEDFRYRNSILSGLEKDNVLHFSKIPEKAKFVVYGRSGDCKATKELRKKILNRICNYCAAIYVDEAQDIVEDVRLILETLDSMNIPLFLYGDPKQDVKGLGQFRILINKTENTEYINETHRCPRKHLHYSNMLAKPSEQQIASVDNAEGSIEVVFESDLESIREFLDSGDFGLKYISMRRDRIDTHEIKQSNEMFEALFDEVKRAMREKRIDVKSELEINRCAFHLTEKMLEAFDGKNGAQIISQLVSRGFIGRLDSKRYSQMKNAFQVEKERVTDIPVVSSIEIVKGKESNRCLFILSSDLAPYLFQEKKEDNRTCHLLYVALTRSFDHLAILIMREVEEKYTRDKILEFFNVAYVSNG